ncbi:MAG: hypothetical protein JRF61_21030 [Deltaproteobacteria bacterium]|nr:hypothetical protein [Deltaproteobacteria bacterium]
MRLATSSLCLFALLLALLIAGCEGKERTSAGRPLDREEMRAAVAEAIRIPDTVEHLARIADLAGRLTAENAEGAADAFDPEIAWVREYDLLPFVHAWTRVDDAAALRRVLEWSSASKRGFGVTEAIYYLALNRDIAKARVHAESITKPRLAEAAMIGLARGWAQSDDLDGLSQYLGRVEQGSIRDQMVRVANGTVALYAGPDRLREWIDGMPAEGLGGLRTRAFRTALGQMAFKDPQWAASWLSDFAGEPFASNMVVAVALPWTERDPHEALAWLHSLPFDDDVAVASRRMATRWIRLDPAAFALSLERAEEGRIRDAMNEAFAMHLVKSAPGAAADRALQIDSSERRIDMLRRILETWGRREPEAATSWLEQADLSDALRQELASRIQSRSGPARAIGASR